MRKTILFFFLCILSFTAFSQSESNDSLSIQAAIDACIQLRDAAAAGDNAAIKQSAELLKACDTDPFSGLKCMDDSVASLNGHLVFNADFADSLAAGRDVYQEADDINRTESTRGQYDDGKVHTKSGLAKANGSVKYTFKSMGRQELAVVPEAGGKVTLKIHVTNSAGLDKRYDDTTDVRAGQSYRKTVFNLSTDRVNIVELEVVNCSNKDCSFVVISN